MAGEVPAGWGEGGLSAFVQAAMKNTFATFANLKAEWSKLEEIDGLFQRAVDNLDNASVVLAPFFLQRAHSAYRGATRLAVSGQCPEAYAVLRSCLEWALYAVSVRDDRSDAEIWLRRQEDDESRQRVKSRFRVERMMRLIDAEDDQLGKTVRLLYERTIDLGAHPNELALTTNASMIKENGVTRFEAIYLAELSDALRAAIKTTAQVGVCTVAVFRLVFRERFDLLGISEALGPAKQGL